VTRVRMYMLLVGLAMATLALAAGPVTVIISLETVVRGDPGEIKPVHDPVPVSDLNAEPGWFCNVSVIAGNGDSEHNGTNMIIGSNGDEVTAFNVEATAGGITEAVGTLTLGETVTFDGRLGEDGVLSAGMNVVFECFEERPPPSTTTTTSIPSSSTTVPESTTTTTESPVTTTTVLPPITTSTTSPVSSTTTTTTTLPPPSSTTTEVPPPTLIESGDAGYIGEEDDGHEHENDLENDLGFLVALVTFGFGLGVLTVTAIEAWRKRDQ